MEDFQKFKQELPGNIKQNYLKDYWLWGCAGLGMLTVRSLAFGPALGIMSYTLIRVGLTKIEKV